MQISVISWDGHNLNDTNFYAVLPGTKGVHNLADTNTIAIMRSENYPSYSGKELSGKNFLLAIQMKGTIATQLDTLKTWFDTKDKTLKKLLVADTANSNKQWYLMADVVSQPKISGMYTEFLLYVPDPVWKAQTATTVNWSVTASGQTQAVAPVGNVPAKPVITITPTAAKTGGYGYKRFVKIKNVHTTNAFIDYPYDITDGGLDTAALVTASKMLANGDDLRVFVDGIETPRWLQGINTSATQVWINLNLQKAMTSAITVAIAATGAVTTITVGRAGLPWLKLIRSTGGIVEIGTELFTYTGVDLIWYTLTGCTRATKGTSMAAHSAADVITFIEHDIWMMYGDSDAVAPVQSETNKPIIKLTSTNNSWIYEEFWDVTGLRSGSWKPSIISSVGKKSTYYTADHITDADIATEMGMNIKAYQVGALWKGESAAIVWDLYHPAGLTTVEAGGETYRVSTTWPAAASLQKATTALKFLTVFNITIPATAAWTTWIKTAQALSATYNYLRFAFTGAIGAVANNEAAFEIDNATLTIDSTKRPSVSVSAEQVNYWLNATVTNTTSGEWIKVQWMMGLNTAIEIDCVNKTAKYDDNTNVLSALTFSTVRQDWLNLAVGTNTLSYVDVGCDDVTVVISFADRNN